jgi:hypothetical protein
MSRECTELRAEKLISLTGRERLRFLWYRLRFEISDVNYASRRVVELRLGMPAKQASLPPAVPEIEAELKSES